MKLPLDSIETLLDKMKITHYQEILIPSRSYVEMWFSCISVLMLLIRLQWLGQILSNLNLEDIGK